MDQHIQQKLSDFFSQFKKCDFNKKEVIIAADEEPSSIFYLTEGIVKQYALSTSGDEVVVNIFKPGAFFPLSWAINDTPNVYYFESVDGAVVYAAPREKVIAFLKSEPDVLYDLVRRMFRGTDGLLTRLTYLMSGTAYNRLLLELLIYARRFNQTATHMIPIGFSEKDLATIAGMSRETVSREIKVMKEKGLIAVKKNKHVITDLSLLEAELAKSTS